VAAADDAQRKEKHPANGVLLLRVPTYPPLAAVERQTG
jgi:hypothetical protein